MDKIKFWAVAIGFLVCLWWLSPTPEPGEEDLVILDSSGQPLHAGKLITAKEDPSLAPEPKKFKTGKVTITTRRGNLPLVLGYAHNPFQHQAGLMHYRVWPRNMHGLLFLFQEEDNYSIWMKNTYLPLDVAFIDRDGYIVQIAKNTTPESEEPIKAEEPVLSVLELAAGSLDKWKITVGDRVRLKYFRSALASR